MDVIARMKEIQKLPPGERDKNLLLLAQEVGASTSRIADDRTIDAPELVQRILAVAQACREEKSARREAWMFKLTILATIAAVTAAIAAVIALRS